MLFNSYEFMFAFLPLALLGFYLSARLGRAVALAWLIGCSVLFYGWWNPRFVPLLLGSVAFNYVLGRLIGASASRPRLKMAVLSVGVSGNLLLLFFYKYLFTLLTFLGLLDLMPFVGRDGLILPLGISFFTFTQIGYLVDLSGGVVRAHGLLEYAVFVMFFPHLIAGPILHNQEMIPQFASPATYRFRLDRLSIGLSIFVIGLCKKVVIADPLGRIADPGFFSPHLLSTYGAWQAVLSYSLQLYFDFSGYSDMAIGIARMFGVVFPLNFNSPYKSRSIIDFWQRWHMTLTHYLNLYLYNPVALWVTRRRAARGRPSSRQAMRSATGFASMILLPVFFTMTLAGIWHGAGLQFLIFGLLHATYLSINHAWRVFRPSRGKAKQPQRWTGIVPGVVLTFLAVLVAQIFFRANSAPDAVSMLGGLLGLHPVAGQIILPARLFGRAYGLVVRMGGGGLITLSDNASVLKSWVRIVVGFLIVWTLPNTQQIMVNFAPALEQVRPFPSRNLRWYPGIRWGLVIGVLLLGSLYGLDDPSRFLYFQF